jgi:hypothetical protein
VQQGVREGCCCQEPECGGEEWEAVNFPIFLDVFLEIVAKTYPHLVVLSVRQLKIMSTVLPCRCCQDYQLPFVTNLAPQWMEQD